MCMVYVPGINESQAGPDDPPLPKKCCSKQHKTVPAVLPWVVIFCDHIFPFATWLLKLESTDCVCTSIVVLNNVACGLLWICESLMLQKIAHCLASHQTQKNKIQTKPEQSLMFGIFTSCAPALRTICSIQIALLISVIPLPPHAELCHRLKWMWKSLNGPTCLRAWLQPSDIALQLPDLWLFHRLLSSMLQRKLMAQRLLCFSTNACHLVRMQPANNLFGVRAVETDGGGRAARCLPLWQTSGDHSAVRADKRGDGEGAKANALGC